MDCNFLVGAGNSWSSQTWMFGSDGGVFSAFGLGILGFKIDFCLEEIDLGRRLLMEEDEILPKKPVSALSAFLLCLMVFAQQSNKPAKEVRNCTHRERERENESE